MKGRTKLAAMCAYLYFLEFIKYLKNSSLKPHTCFARDFDGISRGYPFKKQVLALNVTNIWKCVKELLIFDKTKGVDPSRKKCYCFNAKSVI